MKNLHRATVCYRAGMFYSRNHTGSLATATCPSTRPSAGQGACLTTTPEAAGPTRSGLVLSSLAVVLSGLTCYGLGSIYPPSTLTLLFPRPAAAPLDPTSDAAQTHTKTLEEQLQHLPLVQELKQTPGLTSSRPYAQASVDERYQHSMTAGLLRRPGGLAISPLVFDRPQSPDQATIILHLGRSLCGQNGIVHGGLIATMFDEACARQAILNLPLMKAVTANLNVNYKAPVLADQFVMIKTKLVRVEGRKAFVEASMQSLSGQVFADASALFVQPKYAALIGDGGMVRDALGITQTYEK